MCHTQTDSQIDRVAAMAVLERHAPLNLVSALPRLPRAELGNTNQKLKLKETVCMNVM